MSALTLFGFPNERLFKRNEFYVGACAIYMCEPFPDRGLVVFDYGHAVRIVLYRHGVAFLMQDRTSDVNTVELNLNTGKYGLDDRDSVAPDVVAIACVMHDIISKYKETHPQETCYASV